MHEIYYYNQIESKIENLEINRKARNYKDNIETLITFWEIGKIILEAQKGEKRAKYGDNLIKEWGIKLSEKFGCSYKRTNLMYFRQFYLAYQNVHTLCGQLSWSHYKLLLPLKNENERNYYTNLAILNSLDVRKLSKEIKSNSFNRLSYADKQRIPLIKNKSQTLTIDDMIKDPIIIDVKNRVGKLNEQALHKYIIDMLEDKFLELGTGFMLAGHEYKLHIKNHAYSVDLLFFNIEINAYVVVEVKTRALMPKDIGQVEFYVNYIDNNLKKEHHEKTIGLIIVNQYNRCVIEYITHDNIYFTTYYLQEKN